MAENLVQDGKILRVAAPYDLASGAGCLVGGIFGVALLAADADASEEVDIQLDGVWDLTKVGSQAWSVGDPVYWDNSNKRCTTSATGNTRIGVAVAAVGNGAGETTGRVRLDATGHIGAGSTDIAALTENGGAIGGTNNGDLPDLTPAGVDLTDSTGGTADNTIAAVTVADGTMGGTADGSFETVGATNSGDVSGAIMNNFKEVQAKLAVANANFCDLTDEVDKHTLDVAALAAAVRELATKVNELVAKIP